MQDVALPYGLRRVVLRPISDAGVVGAAVPLPVSQTFSFSESEDFEELRGDDRVWAERGSGPMAEWDLEAGGISLLAYRVLAGGTLAESGVTPNVRRSFKKKVTDARPYFQVEGQAISDNGGDFHTLLFRAKCTESLEGEMADGSFWVTSASGKAYGDSNDDLYEFVQNETAVAISVDNNEIQRLVIDATGGTLVVDIDGDDSGTISGDPATTAAAVTTAIEVAVGAGNVSVAKVGPGVFDITFIGGLADTNVPTMIVDDTNLTGASSSAAAYTINQGG